MYVRRERERDAYTYATIQESDCVSWDLHARKMYRYGRMKSAEDAVPLPWCVRTRAVLLYEESDH